MPIDAPWRLSATELVERILGGDGTATEVVEATLARIEEENARTNAFVTVCEDEARKAAREADRARQAGEEVGPLHGVPIGIKDLEGMKAGVRHTFGSVPYSGFAPDRSHPVVDRLEAAGAIVVGKTNTPEFGHKGATDNLLFGPTSTPFDLERNAGGSSGGSAAAVADGLVPIAQGSDMGGSLRVPGAFCGAIGFKPTFGRVPSSTRPDGFGHHSPTIQIGPIARTTEDAALALEAMAGLHPSDPYSAPAPAGDLVEAASRGVEGLTVGYSPDMGSYPVRAGIAAVVREAVGALEAAGASVKEVDLGLDLTHAELFEAEAVGVGSYMAAMVDGMGGPGEDFLEDHGHELTGTFRAMVERGGTFSAVELRRADRVRTRLLDRLERVLAGVDVLATPTTGIPAFENADEMGTTLGPSEVDGEPVDPTIGWALTVPFNLTGHPAASVPAGLTDAGLPVGVQIVAPRFRDDRILAAAGALERDRPWAGSYPFREDGPA